MDKQEMWLDRYKKYMKNPGFLKFVDDMLPQKAYEFCFNELMPQEAKDLFEEAFALGATPSALIDYIWTKYPQFQDLPKTLFLKALEYHEFLWKVKADKI